MFLESLVLLATMYANVTVPVVPDPNYLQQIYPSADIPDQYLLQNAPVTAPVQTNNGGSTQPTDLVGLVSLIATGGLAYFAQRQKTVTDRRTYMSADTSLKLAQNNQASDAKLLKVTYALSCLTDIVGKFHKDYLETYQTVDGVSLWTYIENLNISNNEDFQAKYVNKSPVNTTGTQSKDKVVATFNQVQQLVTPTPPTVEAPNTMKQVQKATTVATTRTEVNKEAQQQQKKQTDSTTTTTAPT